MPIPEYATNKLVQVVDRLSHDIILGGGDWETVEVSNVMSWRS